MKAIGERIADGAALCGDGAWGTQLITRGLSPGECFETVNLEHPETLAEIATLYLDAGAELITTNTFGASPLNLSGHGLADRTEEINAAAVSALRPVATGRGLVSGSVGPTGRILQPYGDADPVEVAEGFTRQIGALITAGADLICVETMMDLEEARLAVQAARRLSKEIPVIATMTFNDTPRGFFTTMGTTVEQACATLEQTGADFVGSNCGSGIDVMVALAAEFVRHATVPIVIQANAGLPEDRDGVLHYPEEPDFMAERIPALLDLGVAVIGGCCGTGPDHIRAFRTAIDRHRASAS